MILPDLIDRMHCAERDPRVFARFEAFFVFALTLGVLAIVRFGDWWSWGVAVSGLGGLVLSVLGELRAHRLRREGADW